MNIIDIEEIGWKTSEYEDSYLDGEIHQHMVKVATYVKLGAGHVHSPKKVEDDGLATSDTQYIGAYEYAPGGWISDHIHSNAEQWYYIIHGQATMKVGSEEKLSNVGTIVFIPRNTVHSYRVVGDEPLRILNVATFFADGPSITTMAK